jgi:acid phosphatase family membrane protein YuiD
LSCPLSLILPFQRQKLPESQETLRCCTLRSCNTTSHAHTVLPSVNCPAVPSSHTAFVVGLTTALGMLEGTQSNLFALALVLSLVVAYDATGVRLHAGRHASVLNVLIAGEPV